MRDEDNRYAISFCITHKRLYGLGRLRIETSCWLIEKQDFGFARQRLRHGKALLLTTRQDTRWPRCSIQEIGPDQRTFNPLSPFVTRDAAHREREFDVCAHGPPQKGGLLEDHGLLLQCGFVERAAIPEYVALSWRIEPVEELQKRAFSSAISAHYDCCEAFRDCEVNPVKNAMLADSEAEPKGPHQGIHALQ